MPRRGKERNPEKAWGLPIPGGLVFPSQNAYPGWQVPYGNSILAPMIAPNIQHHQSHEPANALSMSPNLAFAQHTLNHTAFGHSFNVHTPVAIHTPELAHKSESANKKQQRNNERGSNKFSSDHTNAIKCEDKNSETKCANTGDATDKARPSTSKIHTESIGSNKKKESDDLSDKAVQCTPIVLRSDFGANARVTDSGASAILPDQKLCKIPENHSSNKLSDICLSKEQIFETKKELQSVQERQHGLSEHFGDRNSADLRFSPDDFKNLLDFPDELLNQSNPSSSSMDIASDESDEDIRHCSSSPYKVSELENQSKTRKTEEGIAASCGLSDVSSSPLFSAVEDNNTNDHLSSASTVILEKSFCEKHHTLEESECHETLYSLKLADGRTLRLISSIPKSYCPGRIFCND